MLESEIKKLKEAINQLNDTMEALKKAYLASDEVADRLQVPPNELPPEVNELPPDTDAGVTALAPINLEDANIRLMDISKQIGDNGATILKLMSERYGATTLTKIDPTLYPQLIRDAELLLPESLKGKTLQ